MSVELRCLVYSRTRLSADNRSIGASDDGNDNKDDGSDDTCAAGSFSCLFAMRFATTPRVVWMAACLFFIRF